MASGDRRRSSLRSARLSRRQWILSLLYCTVCLVFITAIINVVYRYIPVPDAGLMDLSVFPWWSLYPSLVMLSINAGVSEEGGFRGYMQGEMEQRYGPLAAIAFTSFVFWLAHLNHPSGKARVVMLLAYGIALGALTWAVQSTWPSIVTHAVIDSASFTTIAANTGQRWFMRKPAPFAETGVDVAFVVYSVLLLFAIPAGVALLRKLRRLQGTPH